MNICQASIIHTDEQFICAKSDSQIFGLSSNKELSEYIVKYTYSVKQFMLSMKLLNINNASGTILSTKELTAIKLLHNNEQL